MLPENGDAIMYLGIDTNTDRYSARYNFFDHWVPIYR